MMYPIRVVRLASNETIICGIAKTGSVYQLERPMSVSFVAPLSKTGKPGEPMMFLRPWIEFSKDEMFIVPDHVVVCVSNPYNDILKDYNEAKVKFDLFNANEDLEDAKDDFFDDEEDDGEELA